MKRALFILSFFISSAYAVDYGYYAGFGVSYINSKGLNMITEGLDQGYVTSFGKIRMPLNFEGGVYLGFDRSKVGLGTGYEFTSRDSYSEVYAVTETVSYRTIPIFAQYRYMFYKGSRWEIGSGGTLGIFNSKISMKNQPSVQDNETYGMSAWGFLISADTDVLFALSRNVSLFSTLGFRYGKSASFSYTADTSKHSKGEKVVFSDGSNLTLNLTGLKFLIGIMLSWS